MRWFGSEVMEARPDYVLEADQGKTIVIHVAEGELFGWMRLMRPMAALMAEKRTGANRRVPEAFARVGLGERAAPRAITS